LVKDEDFHSSKGWCGNRPRCVTVARKPEGVAVRDSKNTGSGRNQTLFFTNAEWRAFVSGVKAGEFDV
jgi:hypothetical protein